MPIADYQILVTDMVRDESSIVTDEQRDRAIHLAVVRYSTDRPREITQELEHNGGNIIDMPEGWSAGHSRILQIISSDGGYISGEPYLMLDGMAIMLSRSLRDHENITIIYTSLHNLEISDTIPLADREAVASYAAAFILEQLANYYSGTQSGLISADSVDWQSKGREFAARAKSLRKFYFDHVGIDLKRNVPAGVVVDLDRKSSLGHDRIIHSQKRR